MTGPATGAEPDPRPSVGTQVGAVSVELVRAAVDEVEDPEIPVTLAGLGVVREVLVDGNRVRLVLAPTRLGCPAKDEIARRLSRAAATVPGVVDVEVDWRNRRWSTDDVSETGRRALGLAGYTVTSAVQHCPYCSSDDAEALGAFGGSVCRQSWRCRSCGSPYEALRSAGDTAAQLRTAVPLPMPSLPGPAGASD